MDDKKSKAEPKWQKAVPVSARCVATHLKLDYSLVKRVVRGLVAWRILERTADGLQFQPDAGR